VRYANAYVTALRKLKLIPHHFVDLKTLKNSSDSFWSKDIKSKGPYKWSMNYKSDFPWIGFVGYELHFDGSIRIRKSSLKKELEKQYKIKNEVIVALKAGRRSTLRNGTIIESVIKKLHGMSIGRGELWNIAKIDTEMCWAKGYSELNKNKHVIRQLKLLDKARNHHIEKLKDEVYAFDDKHVPIKHERGSDGNTIYYGKPFSYYFYIIEKGSTDL